MEIERYIQIPSIQSLFEERQEIQTGIKSEKMLVLSAINVVLEAESGQW